MNAESKHTPGPWEIGFENCGGGFTITADGVRVAHTARFFASGKKDLRDLSEDEAKANGHLIAAAPEMLAALRLALPALCRMTTVDPSADNAATAVARAISKAEDRS
ncbi:hypothetical protein V5F41_08195 [Xanthobacter autotrophicus]|uniref:hypothetical protein n=1 Tax=Xanthobacter autotrophicus TaxID=280 RepID=UPI00372B5BF3